MIEYGSTKVVKELIKYTYHMKATINLYKDLFLKDIHIRLFHSKYLCDLQRN